MDLYPRRIIGFGVAPADLDGPVVCRMFNRAIAKQTPPQYLSSDNDPLFRFYLSHTAGAQRRHDLVGPEFPAHQRPAVRRRDRHVLNRRSFKEAPGSFFVRQQQLDLPTQLGLSTACSIKPCLPLLPRTSQRRVEEFLHSPPTFLAHGRSILAL